MKLLIAIFTLCMSSLCFAQAPPPIGLDQVLMDEGTRIQLNKSIIEEAPGLILVVDSKTLKVSAFVNGDPERQDPKRYFLVDVMLSSNGRPGKETPEGIFTLLSERMNEKDWSHAYRKELFFTLFWRNIRTKQFDGYGIHAASPARVKKLGMQCASSGCVNLHPTKAENLFSEVVQHFSSQHKGSDVLVLSLVGSNTKIPSPEQWNPYFLAPSNYFERWSQLSANQVQSFKESKPMDLNLRKLGESLIREEILLDTRKPIAGNGDTASSIFLIQNLLSRGYTGTIDLLFDEKSGRILKSLSQNLAGFDPKRIRLLTVAELEAKTYSLVIRTGQPSGRILIENMVQVSAKRPAAKARLNVNSQTIFLAFTIYGNTQNRFSLQPVSLSGQGKSYYLMPSPGMGAVRSAESGIQMEADQAALKFGEAGIFRDPFSLGIRDWPIEKIESFLSEESRALNPDFHELLERLFILRKQNQAKYSLAYGFSIPQVQSQARDYFRSLLTSPKPVVVLTPSAFSQELFDSFSLEERKKILRTSLKEFATNGRQLNPNQLTIIQIPNVPHQVFSSLLLASHRNRVVPLGAGDGFFTTALSLGIPFSPTVVEWNIRNVRSLSRILQVEALKQGFGFSHMQNLRRLYSAIPSDPIQLGFSQQLMRYEDLFRSAVLQIPDLTETIDTTVQHLRAAGPVPEGMRPIEKNQKIFVGQKNQIDEKHGGGLRCQKIYL